MKKMMMLVLSLMVISACTKKSDSPVSQATTEDPAMAESPSEPVPAPAPTPEDPTATPSPTPAPTGVQTTESAPNL